MRYVLQVFSSLNKGGAESRVMDLYRKLDRSKIQFSFAVTSPGEGFYMEEIRRLGGKIYTIKSWRETGFFRWVMQWKNVFSNTDVVHSHTGFESGLIVFLAWMFGVPKRISHARDMLPESGHFHRMKEYLLRMMICCFSTDLIGCSYEAGNYIFGKRAMRTRGIFLPNAIQLKHYQVMGEFNRADYRRSLGIDIDAFVLGTVGNLRKVKNQGFMIDILKELRKIIPDAVLIIAGEGHMRQSLLEYARKLKIEKSVYLCGQRNDIPEFLAGIDVFLLTSFSEGMPGSVIEAQSAGVPSLLSDTITKDVDANVGLVRFLSLEASAKVWAECIQQMGMYTRPDLQMILSKMKVKNFDVEDSLKQLLTIYFDYLPKRKEENVKD